jgi:cell division protein FtsB
MKNAIARVVRKPFWLTLALIVTFGLTATPARAGIADIILLLKTITTTLQNSIGAVLSEVRTVENTVNTLHQEIVWPLTAINQAKGFVTSTINQYRGMFNQIRNTAVESATLVNPSHLEAAFRSSAAGALQNIQPTYTQVYSSVPDSTNAQIHERNMMDMDDASAMGSLKTAAIADQTSSHMQSIADSIEQQASQAAPGSAPLLAAQAQIANLENQAYLAKIFAAELRAEATKLAHENSLLKRSAEHSTTLRVNMQQVLK